MDEMNELLSLFEQVTFEIQRLRQDTSRALPLMVDSGMQGLMGRAGDLAARRNYFLNQDILLSGGDRRLYDTIKAVMFDTIRPAERQVHVSDYGLFVSRLPIMAEQFIYHAPIKGVSEVALGEEDLGLYMSKSYYVFQVKASHSRDAGVLRIRLPGVDSERSTEVNLTLRVQATLQPGQPWWSFSDKTQLNQMCDYDYVLEQVWALLQPHCDIDPDLYSALTPVALLGALQNAYVSMAEPPFPVRSENLDTKNWMAFSHRAGKPNVIPYVLQVPPNEELCTPGVTQPCYAYYAGNRDVFILRGTPPPLDRPRDAQRFVSEFFHGLRASRCDEFYAQLLWFLPRMVTLGAPLPPCSKVGE